MRYFYVYIYPCLSLHCFAYSSWYFNSWWYALFCYCSLCSVALLFALAYSLNNWYMYVIYQADGWGWIAECWNCWKCWNVGNQQFTEFSTFQFFQWFQCSARGERRSRIPFLLSLLAFCYTLMKSGYSITPDFVHSNKIVFYGVNTPLFSCY